MDVPRFDATTDATKDATTDGALRRWPRSARIRCAASDQGDLSDPLNKWQCAAGIFQSRSLALSLLQSTEPRRHSPLTRRRAKADSTSGSTCTSGDSEADKGSFRHNEVQCTVACSGVENVRVQWRSPKRVTRLGRTRCSDSGCTDDSDDWSSEEEEEAGVRSRVYSGGRSEPIESASGKPLRRSLRPPAAVIFSAARLALQEYVD